MFIIDRGIFFKIRLPQVEIVILKKNLSVMNNTNPINLWISLLQMRNLRFRNIRRRLRPAKSPQVTVSRLDGGKVLTINWQLVENLRLQVLGMTVPVYIYSMSHNGDKGIWSRVTIQMPNRN